MNTQTTLTDEQIAELKDAIDCIRKSKELLADLAGPCRYARGEIRTPLCERFMQKSLALNSMMRDLTDLYEDIMNYKKPVDQKWYYCDSVKFNITKIKWDYDESNELKFPYADLPSELHDWAVRGYPHWLESEWNTACIEQIEDAYYGWRIRHAKIERKVERCETE